MLQYKNNRLDIKKFIENILIFGDNVLLRLSAARAQLFMMTHTNMNAEIKMLLKFILLTKKGAIRSLWLSQKRMLSDVLVEPLRGSNNF